MKGFISMNKEKLKWYTPENFEQAYKLHLNNPSIIPAGGCTGILRVKRFKNEGFINLKKCNLSYIKKDKSTKKLIIGSTTTFNEIIDYLKVCNPPIDSFYGIFLSSLTSSASYPLRNRITIGGSLYDLPIWSDIISPLLLTTTTVIYNDDKKIELLDYIEQRKNFPHIIKEIIIEFDENLKYYTERFSLTNFDYAVFRFSFSFLLGNDSRFNSFTAAISGNKKVVFFDKNFNDKFLKVNIDDKESLKNIIYNANYGFSDDFRFDKEYKENTLKSLFFEAIKNIKI